MSQPDRYLLAGVMGYPVMHSRSPMVHNYWLDQHGLVGRYLPLAIKVEHLAAALRALPALGFAGCNLTMPHKEAALTIVDRLAPNVQTIGALNCVTASADGSLEGHNFEASGYVESIAQAVPGWDPSAGPVVIVGAGGGARAVIAGLVDRGARQIRLCNRTPERADRVACHFGPSVETVPWADRHEAIADALMLVNATSQGMHGQPALDISLCKLPETAIVSDLVYTPLETPLLAEARRRGNRTINGLGMMLNQARHAFHAWFGVMPEVTVELRAAIEATI